MAKGLSSIPTPRTTVIFAQHLRKRLTDAETKLWYYLRRRQLAGYRFRKQAPIGHYIADFVCLELKIIVELDGGQHNEEPNFAYDHARTLWFEQQGYKVIRFWNNDVLQLIESVLQEILQVLQTRANTTKFQVSPLPSLPPKKRGEGTMVLQREQKTF